MTIFAHAAGFLGPLLMLAFVPAFVVVIRAILASARQGRAEQESPDGTS